MRHVESLDFDLVDLSFIGDIILVLEKWGVTPVWLGNAFVFVFTFLNAHGTKQALKNCF